MLLRRSFTLCAAVVAASLAAAPVRAADLDKFLPADTEIFFRVNVAQFLKSPLAKDIPFDQAGAFVKQAFDYETLFKDIGFDISKDLETVTAAQPTGKDADRGLIIIHGKFNVEKIKAKLEAAAKGDDSIKAHKIADGVVYEVNLPFGDQPAFLAVPNEKTVLLSMGKDYVVNAIKQSKQTEPLVLKNKDFGATLQSLNPNQTISIAALGSAIEGYLDDPSIKEKLKGISSLGGGVTLGESIKIEVVLGAKTIEDARSLHRTVNTYLQLGQLLIGQFAAGNEQLQPVVDIVKTLRCSIKEKAVTFKGEITPEVIEALKKALGGLGG